MFEHTQSTLKRKEAIKKQLFEHFGFDKKIYIDEELVQAETLLAQGYDFQEVFEMLKYSIETRTSKKLIPEKPINPLPIENSRSSSTDKPPSSRYTILSPPKNRKSLEHWQDYSKKNQKFYEEFAKVNSNLEKAQINSYRQSPTLEYQSKVDEIRALEAAKLREMQAQELEFKKRIDKLIAERENMNHLNKQMLEKKNHYSNLRLENKQYRNEVENRSNFVKLIEQSERERRSLEKGIYNKALNEQMLIRNKDRVRVNELDRYGKELSGHTRSSPDSERSFNSGSSSVLPQVSPIKFLVQYGHYISGKNH